MHKYLKLFCVWLIVMTLGYNIQPDLYQLFHKIFCLVLLAKFSKTVLKVLLSADIIIVFLNLTEISLRLFNSIFPDFWVIRLYCVELGC